MIRDIGYLKILKTGPGTSVQDSGRTGVAYYGVPISGALDQRSYGWANHLLQNQTGDAALEICQPGLKIQFDTPTLICLAGAKAEVKLNGNSISSYGLIEIQAYDQLEIGAFHQGSVLYLAIKNGFQTEPVLNSRSWMEGITPNAYAKKGDQIPFFTHTASPKYTAAKPRWDFRWAQRMSLEVYPGPEWDLLDLETQGNIQSNSFSISSHKNRMAIQLTELQPHSLPEMLTAPVYPGTVQLTSGGKMIVLMKDAQVTGGYPRILQLTEQAIDQISQKCPSDIIRFELKKP
ncbi:biotin-dependent carboxyltransferase family protein [Algoriphagus halophytocola]|uniref:Biotin-dependent carboxyltransferase family protein n=1 Tax=Algoriphagus halophytocola TaxID=2991499 RepID=A0ABY6MJB2_9BACT|nr:MULTISPECIES: biotin-dependent carboxyltransferase family protein [unclassified Algoriphagus]UZD23125.1 biotin-dependent carboxyltransferase family protein [Algoriphagus sp. TR-M5]WBL44417.1 biotin-dependent carboxyltransferase family protein [Algoriphagus sp. TR-M9]